MASPFPFPPFGFFIQVIFALGASIAATAHAASESRATDRRPNIILLLPDQMRGSALGVAGNPDVQSLHSNMPATLLGLAGLTVPAHLQGADLSRVALAQTTVGPDAVLLQIFAPFRPDHITAPWRGLITDRSTYARYENAPWVLFDNQRDPAQMTTLAVDPAHTPLRRDLDAKLAALMASKSDAWSFNSQEPVEEAARLSSKATYYSVQDYLAATKLEPAQSK
jgi:arylsulfatase A-like enzyme